MLSCTGLLKKIFRKRINMFNKKGFKKAGLCIVTALVIMGTSGCNTKIKPNYGYNPTDHVELGQYKGIEYSVDEEGIEKDIINKRILSDQKDNITYQEITSRGAKEADKVTVDFSATINGLQVSGFSNNDYEIVLGTDTFNRIRIGIGRPEIKHSDVADFVLSHPKDQEVYEKWKDGINKAAAAAEYCRKFSFDKARNRFNK